MMYGTVNTGRTPNLPVQLL